MQTVTHCPVCQQIGTKIDTATVKSQIIVSLHRVSDYPYHFCKQANCEVVYYDEAGAVFTVSDVREQVYQKQPYNDDVLVCYCFYHTLGAIKQHIQQHKGQTIVDDINTGIQTGKCACDWRNPQGSCCLGNVRKLMKEMNPNT